MRTWIAAHREAILTTIIALQIIPGLGNGAKNILMALAFVFGGAV